MNNAVRTDQVGRILHSLAHLPGSAAVRVTSRKFPRFGPVGPGSSFEERTSAFPVDQVPHTFVVQTDMEQVVISVRGALPEECTRDELVRHLQPLLEASDIEHDWELRANVPETASGYELTFFTH